MIKINILGIFSIFLFIIACNRTTNQVLKLPLMHQIANSQNTLKLENEKVLLVYINGDCIDCIMELNIWDSLLTYSSVLKNCQISFFTDAYDTTQYKEMKKRFTHFNQPVFYNFEQNFWPLNRLNITMKPKSYFIYNNKLIAQGNYLYDKKYREKVNEQIE